MFLVLPILHTYTILSFVLLSQEMGTSIKIHTLKMAGLNNIIKRQIISMLLRSERVDMVCLQKTHIRADEERYLKKVFSGIVYHASVQNRCKGTIGLSHRFHLRS